MDRASNNSVWNVLDPSSNIMHVECDGLSIYYACYLRWNVLKITLFRMWLYVSVLAVCSIMEYPCTKMLSK